jgi:hypothetical protein
MVEALNLVMEINEDDTPRVAFFGYSGHVKSLDIEVHPNGWNPRKVYKLSFSDYMDQDAYTEGRTRRGNKVTEIVQYESFDDMLAAIRRVGL